MLNAALEVVLVRILHFVRSTQVDRTTSTKQKSNNDELQLHAWLFRISTCTSTLYSSRRREGTDYIVVD